MSVEKANLAEKLAQFDELWAPRIIAQFNDCKVMVAKLEGEFVWHKHDATDDLFLVIGGKLDVELRDGAHTLGAGELLVVPRGVEHRPVARYGQAQVLLIEKQGTPNTGDTATAAPERVL